MIFRRKLELLAQAAFFWSALAAPFTATANAQTTTVADSAAAATTEDEIVVTATPIRDSLERSLEIQRKADNIVNVIAADTIGRFPDATAAGALSRLPSVGVQRDQGQERYIQVRGAPTRWSAVSLDGINVLGAEDRIFRFDSVPAVQISQLELNKTLTPEMPAEALAGRVNIVSYSPMSNDGFHAYVDGGYGMGDLGDGPAKQYAARLSWANDMFGLSLSGSHFSFEQHTDNSEPRFDAVGMSQLRITKYVIERQTESYSAKLEFEPSPDHHFSLTHLKTEFNDFEERNQYRWQFSRALSGTRNFETADLVGVPQEAAYEDGIYSNGVYYTVLHGEHELGGWKADWNVAYTTTEFNTNTPGVIRTTSNVLNAPTAATAPLLPSVHINVNAIAGGIPNVTLYSTVSNGAGGFVRGPAILASVNDVLGNVFYATEFSSTLETESWTYKGDVRRDWSSLGAEATFSAGFQMDSRSQDGSLTALVRPDGTVSSNNASGFNLVTQSAALGLPWTPGAFVSNAAWDTNFDFGYLGTYVRSEAMLDQLGALMAAARTANAAGANIAVFGTDPRSINTVDETVTSAYFQNRWKWNRHTLLTGVRVEQTEIDTKGFLAQGLVPLHLSSDEVAYFPSLHYSFDYSDDIKLRAALISGQARPSLSDMQATVSVNDTSQTITGGNPFIVPEKAYGLDLSAEWYFAPASILAISAYHREVKDTLFDSGQIVGDSRYDSGGINRANYTLSSAVNGGDGALTGVELTYYHPWNFLPGWLSGFGFQGSIALNTGEFDAPNGDGTFSSVEFPGTSDRIYNATLFYEKYGLSARLVYQYRTDWLDEVFPSGSAANSNLYWDATERLDFSARYQATDAVSLYFDAVNIFNEYGVRYQAQENRPYEVESFGRRFMVGVRANF